MGEAVGPVEREQEHLTPVPQDDVQVRVAVEGAAHDEAQRRKSRLDVPALAVSSILGLTIARHFLRLDALTDISEPQIEATIRPWLTAAFGGGTAAPPAP
ncbi:hypothetical protein [Streptomyces sp. NPDC048644]|uniref:hypothetical protein n=1 Tax=Streptomyces sp. NPDC048644 TaxID=3365582 RepID=UPI00371FEBEE